MKIVIAILTLVGALSAQVIEDSSASSSSRKTIGVVGISKLTSSGKFELSTDCSSLPARWDHLQGTIVFGNGVERKIIHEAWVKIDRCQSQGIAALFCRKKENPGLLVKIVNQEMKLTRSMLAISESTEISAHCGPTHEQQSSN